MPWIWQQLIWYLEIWCNNFCFSKPQSFIPQKIIFLSSDGASVNSGDKSDLISLHEDQEWVMFIWCFSHHLELALKDGLKMYTSPVDKSLMHHFFMNKNSYKKHRKLNNLYQLMKGQFELYSDGVNESNQDQMDWP